MAPIPSHLRHGHERGAPSGRRQARHVESPVARHEERTGHVRFELERESVRAGGRELLVGAAEGAYFSRLGSYFHCCGAPVSEFAERIPFVAVCFLLA